MQRVITGLEITQKGIAKCVEEAFGGRLAVGSARVIIEPVRLDLDGTLMSLEYDSKYWTGR